MPQSPSRSDGLLNRVSSVTPFGYLRLALRSLPNVVKFVIATGALAAVVALISLWHVPPAALIFGSIAILVGMFGLLVFSALVSKPSPDIPSPTGPAWLMLWSFTIIIIASAVLTAISLFFNKPIPLRDLVVPPKEPKTPEVLKAIDDASAIVSDFNVAVVYTFLLSEADLDPKLARQVQDIPEVYCEMRDGTSGQTEFWVLPRMDSELSKQVEAELLKISDLEPLCLIIDPRGGQDIAAVGARSTRLSLGRVSGYAVESGFVGHVLLPPGGNTEVGKQVVGPAKVSWAIMKNGQDSPRLFWTWSYHIPAPAAQGLRIVNDFRKATMAAIVPRLSPDFDSAPSLATTRGRFGGLNRVEVDVRGLKREWVGSARTPVNTSYIRHQYRTTGIEGTEGRTPEPTVVAAVCAL